MSSQTLKIVAAGIVVTLSLLGWFLLLICRDTSNSHMRARMEGHCIGEVVKFSRYLPINFMIEWRLEPVFSEKVVDLVFNNLSSVTL
jgi:hypothetical protein